MLCGNVSNTIIIIIIIIIIISTVSSLSVALQMQLVPQTVQISGKNVMVVIMTDDILLNEYFKKIL